MDVIKLTQKLVKINSENPPGNEGNVAEFIEDYMKDTDFNLTKLYPEKNRPILIFEKGRGEGFISIGTISISYSFNFFFATSSIILINSLPFIA